jgi:hypothetical protein
MGAANANRPLGTRYNHAMGKWLRENGLDGITNQERYRALLCLENLEAIEVWHASLDDAQRRRLNHPGAIWAHWRRSTVSPETISERVSPETVSERTGRDGKSTKPPKPRSHGKPIYWRQEMLRRAATALRETRSSDIFVVARAVLEAAIRNQDDVAQLLNDAKPPHQAKHRSAQLHRVSAAA